MQLAQKLPWTVRFLSEWWPQMSLSSVLHLRDYEIRNTKGGAVEGAVLSLNMRSPVRGEVSLREVGSDMHTFTEVFREQVYGCVLDQVKECSTVIDLGANIGLAALYFAAHYPSCRLFTVEPHPGTYQMLTRNLGDLIREARCRTLKAAVWKDETTLVGDFDEPEHYSAFAMREATSASGDELQTVGLSMPAIIAESGFDTIDILKVDIEGAEVELFKGDVSWLSRVRCIAIEFHADSRAASEFDGLMQQYGFRVIDNGPHTVLAIREPNCVATLASN